MSKRLYELTLLVTTNKGADEKQVKKDLSNIIGKAGKIVDFSMWERRPLAYPINNENEAVFFIVSSLLDTNKVSEVDAKLRLKEDVLRHILVRKEKSEEQKKLEAKKEMKEQERKETKKEKKTEKKEAKPKEEKKKSKVKN